MIAVVAQIPAAATAACESDNLYLKTAMGAGQLKGGNQIFFVSAEEPHSLHPRRDLSLFFPTPVFDQLLSQGLTVQYF